MQLKDKVAAVTGGTAGIGRAITEAFLREGARVAIFARNAEKAEKMMAEIGAGDDLIFIQGDATVQADVEGMVDKTVEAFGTIDILVNNAGGAGDDGLAFENIQGKGRSGCAAAPLKGELGIHGTGARGDGETARAVLLVKA